MVGRWLDQKYNTEPWLFLTSVGVCFIISMFGLIRSALKEFKNIEKESKNNEKE
jgi:F0F1-type ATP synthase assembly protein I